LVTTITGSPASFKRRIAAATKETYENGWHDSSSRLLRDGSVTIQKNGVRAAPESGTLHLNRGSQGRTAASTMSGVTLVMHR